MSEEITKKAERLLPLMRVPKVHWGASWDKEVCGVGRLEELDYAMDVKKAKDNWKAFREAGENLLFYGPYGSGKSALAAMFLRDLVDEQSIAGYWVNALRIQEMVIQKWQHDDQMTCWERALTSPVLVIDDLVLTKEQKFQDKQLEILVRARLDNGAFTIVTANMDVDAMRELYPALAGAMDGTYVQIEVDKWNFRTNDTY